MPKSRTARTASHAGSWYDADADVLAGKVRSWLEQAPAAEYGRVRAVIAPHAGYSYCGPVMAHAYKYISPELVKRVFILGPSHHLYSRQCLISPHREYATPLGPAPVDARVYAELEATGAFGALSRDADEAEHSLELHLPFLVEVMRGHAFTVVPIVVGALTARGEADYGALLAPYLADAANFFIISSDFCHWGSRFGFTFRRPEDSNIAAGVEWLDRQGMSLIEARDAAGFGAYLQRYGNTICGRHPIAVFLQAGLASAAARPVSVQALQVCRTPHEIKFTKYAQSHRCTNPRESSVSYASAVVSLAPAANGNA